MRFSVEKVLHKLALESEGDDEPSSFDELDFGWILALLYRLHAHKMRKRSV